MNLNALLKQKFPNLITDDEASLEAYSRDASIFKIHPQAVFSPKTAAQIGELVKWCAEQKQNFTGLSLTPRAGGTDMTGGSINESIIVDVSKNLNVISNLTETSVNTQSGVFFRDLEVKLAARGKVMPTYPVSKAWCGVGGMVGNNCGGEKTFSYGQAINFVKELKVILADGKEYVIKRIGKDELDAKLAQKNFEGKIYQQIFELITQNYRQIISAKPNTSKNSTGYNIWDVWDGETFDLSKLFVGSQGTLGIISEIKWKIVPLLRHRQLAVFYLNDLKQLGELALHVNELKPESFEIFDQHTFKLAMKYLPEIISKMRGSQIKLLWNFLPEAWLAMTGRLPKLVLLAEFTGQTQEEAFSKAKRACQNVEEHFNLATSLPKFGLASDKFWTIRRESFNLLRSHNARKISAPFIEDIIVHPDQLPDFMPELDKILSQFPDFIYTIAGHAGDANFHIIPLVDLTEQKHKQQIIEMSEQVFALVIKYKGSISAEHNDGLVRGPFLKQMYGEEMVKIFEQVKNIFDPQNIFNPHKKTDATLSYYADHIRAN